MEKFKNLTTTALGQTFKTEYSSFGLSVLMKGVLEKSSGHLSESTVAGNMSEKSIAKILEFFDKHELRLVYNNIGAGWSTKVLLSDSTLVEFTVSGSQRVDMNFCSEDEKFVADLFNMGSASLIREKKIGAVYAIVSSGGRLSLQHLGNAGIPLIKHNYMPSVINDYEFIIKDLKAKSPSGRIAILEGFPGSGKTHIVRSLLLDVPTAMFVLVPPDMVTSLGNPEFLPLLLQYKHHSNGGPIILILEDADKCLVNRNKGNNLSGPDNMNTIQSLLNLGDGILGSLMDVRIIATTNASQMDMEPAILRPGRLSKRIEVGPLDRKHAANILQQLLPNNEEVLKDNRLISKQEMSLAEVYFLAREYGWSPIIDEEKDFQETSKPSYDDEDEDEYF